MKNLNLCESGVRFDEEQHRYWLGEKELKGITSTFVKRLNPNEYKDVADAKLAERAEYGHGVHAMVDFCLENDAESEAVEWGLYKNLMCGRGLEPAAIEYIVTDGEKYASPIDLVFAKEDGTVVLVDVKTNYAPPIEKATVQLSWYKRWFERMNPSLKVSECAVLWLRDDEKRGPLSGWYVVKPWGDDMLDALIKCYEEAGEWSAVMNTWGDFPAMLAEVEDEIARLEIDVKAAQERQKELKQGLFSLMEKNNIKSFDGARVKLTMVLPSKSTVFDSTRFKKEHPDMYKEYTKETEKAGSLRITVKG